MAQTIYEKIENKGQNDALEIKRIGEEKANRLKAEVIERTEEVVQNMIKNANEVVSEKLKTKNTEFLQEASQSSLKNRKKIIKLAFDKTFEKMKNFSDEELLNYILKVLKSSNIQGDEEIKVASFERQRYINLFSKHKNSDLDILNNLLGKEYKLRLSSEDASIDGGFILESDYFDIDYSYRTVLKDLMNEVETELAKILFEG